MNPHDDIWIGHLRGPEIKWGPPPSDPGSETYVEEPTILSKVEFTKEMEVDLLDYSAKYANAVSRDIERHFRTGIRVLEGRIPTEDEFEQHANMVHHPHGIREYRWHETTLVTQHWNTFPHKIEVAAICLEPNSTNSVNSV